MLMNNLIYNYLKRQIEKLNREKVLAYKEELKASGKYKDFNTRFCFDLFYSIKAEKRNRIANLIYYKYNGNDSHLKTGLLKVAKELNYI